MSATPVNRKSALWIACAVVLFDSAGMGLILPVLPQLLGELSARDLSQAAIIGGFLTTSYALMQFLFGPLLGNLSDKFGRKPLLLLSVGLLAVDYVIMALAPSIWVLFVGRLIAGFAGANYTVAFAITADISGKADRAKNFGIVGGAFGLGFIIGPLIGGLLGAEMGIRAPFWAAAIVVSLSFVVSLFLFRETLLPGNRRTFKLRRANPVGALNQLWQLKLIRPLLIVWFLVEFAEFIYPTLWAFYTPVAFDWDLRQVGISLFVFGVLATIVQGVLTGPIVARFGERTTCLFALMASFVGLLLFGVISDGWMVYPALIVSMLGALFAPAMMGLMSMMMAENEQGELQGMLASLTALATIFTPLIATRIFASTTDAEGLFLPGAPFLFSAVIMLVAFWPLLVGLRALQDHTVGDNAA